MFNKKSLNIGVDIGSSVICLVKTRQSGDGKHEILGYDTVPFDPDLPLDSTDFSVLLSSALRKFTPYISKVKIWSLVSAARVNILYLRIPKVPKKEIYNAVYWTYKKTEPLDEPEVIFDFHILGETVENGFPKIEIIAYTVPRHEVEGRQQLFADCGYPLNGISCVPFALQNLFRTGRVDHPGKTVGSLYIGRTWSRIDVFKEGDLVFSRGIKTGMHSMVEAIEESGGSTDSAGGGTKLLVDRIDDTTSLEDLMAGLSYSEDQLLEIVQPVLDRLVRQVRMTLEFHLQKFGGEPVETLYFSGQLVSHERLIDLIGSGLNISARIIDPFNKPAALPAPDSASGRVAMVPAVGAALSDDAYTPNFIHTYRDKERESASLRLNHMVFSFFVILVLVLGGLYFWQTRAIGRGQARIAELQQQIQETDLLVNQDLILGLTTRMQRNRESVDSYGRKYMVMAVLGELSVVTPPRVRLLSINADFGKASKTRTEKKDEQPEEEEKRLLRLEGLVLGDRLTYETTLVEYLVRLGDSPLFTHPNVTGKTLETLGENEVMRFSADLELL